MVEGLSKIKLNKELNIMNNINKIIKKRSWVLILNSNIVKYLVVYIEIKITYTLFLYEDNRYNSLKKYLGKSISILSTY